MRSTKKLLGVGLLAGVVIAGGSAFTDSNTGVSASKLGYGSVSASGVDISQIKYVADTLDSSLLSKVEFLVPSTDLSNLTSEVTLSGASGVLSAASNATCVPTLLSTLNIASALFSGAATGDTQVVCTLSTEPTVASVTSVAISVHS